MDLLHAPLFIDKIDEAVRTQPEQLAVIDLSTPEPTLLTYRSLSNLANRTAVRLLQLGVQRGEAVAYQLPTGWEFITLTLALWRISATPCPLLPSLREREVSFIMKSSGSRLLVVPDSFRNFSYEGMVEAIRSDIPNLERVFVVSQAHRNPATSEMGGLLPAAGIPTGPATSTASTASASAAGILTTPPAAASGSAPATASSASASGTPSSSDLVALMADRRPNGSTHAQLLYTSGTTGEPKGVLQTHQSLSAGLLSHTTMLGLSANDRIWVPSPLAHQTGFLYGMMVAFYLGAAGVYQAAWSVETAREAIETHGATFVQAAMPFLADLTRHPAPPKGLRLFIATGAAIPRALAHEAREKLACSVVGAWGSTESCLVTVGRPDDPIEKLIGTDGRVIDGMEIRIVDDEGHVLPSGQEGNYEVKTPAMFSTYLHHHEWFEAAMTADGFFQTGDLATIDVDGYLRITGRKKDVVNRGGEKIPVVEIEDLLYRHPAIADVSVVAMPDDRLGERACAYIVVKPGVEAPDLSAITDFLANEGMAKIYWPERIEVIEEMPRTASGKIQKYMLRNDITTKLAAEKA